MAFPSATGTKQDSLALAWERARSVAATVKSRTQTLRDQSAAGPTAVGEILNYATVLAEMRLALARSQSVSGIGAYAQAQVADPALNVATEFSNMLSTLDATTAWIVTNFPKDAGGFLLAVTFTADNTGRTQFRTLSSAQTAGLRT